MGHCKCTDDIQSRIVRPRDVVVVVVVVGERLHFGWKFERELVLGLVGMLLDCE